MKAQPLMAATAAALSVVATAAPETKDNLVEVVTLDDKVIAGLEDGAQEAIKSIATAYESADSAAALGAAELAVGKQTGEVQKHAAQMRDKSMVRILLQSGALMGAVGAIESVDSQMVKDFKTQYHAQIIGRESTSRSVREIKRALIYAQTGTHPSEKEVLNAWSWGEDSETGKKVTFSMMVPVLAANDTDESDESPDSVDIYAEVKHWNIPKLSNTRHKNLVAGAQFLSSREFQDATKGVLDKEQTSAIRAMVNATTGLIKAATPESTS